MCAAHTYSVGVVPRIDLSLTVHKFLSEQEAAEKAIIRYFYESGGDIDYFYSFINEIRQITFEDENSEIIGQIRSKTLDITRGSYLSVEAKIVLLRTIYEAGCFSKELMRELVKLTAEINNNISLKYWLLSDLSRIWFLYPKILYDEYWTEKKQIMRDCARELRLNWNPPAYTGENNPNICVMATFLGCEMKANPVTLGISRIVRALSNRGYKLHVIETLPLLNDSSMGIMKPIFCLSQSVTILRKEELLQYFPEDIEFYQISNAMIKNRLQDILDLICKINPFCILEFTNDYIPISYYYYQNYPTIYCSLTKVGYSSSFFHKYVIPNEEAVVYSPILEEQALRLPLCIEYIKPLRTFSRKEYGLTEADIVIITVGYRLPIDISNKLAEQMCSLLRSNKKIKWLIVGCSELPYIKKYHEDLIGKSIIFISYEADLPGLYQICDIYLNPDRSGGGTTIAWAMQHKLAIVSPLGAADGTNIIGKNNALPFENDLAPFIDRLSKDSELLYLEKEKYAKIAAKWDINLFTDGLIQGMNELAENFTQRI